LKKKLRKIVVDGKTYLWKHNYGEDYYSVPLCLRILLEENRATEIQIIFSLTDKPIEKYVLNSGFEAVKSGESVFINLNEPKYIAEIIQHLCYTVKEVVFTTILKMQSTRLQSWFTAFCEQRR
jgi:hypothetical protein